MATRAELDAWVLAVAPRAVAYARSLLKHPHDAEDVVQECFARLLANRQYDLLADGRKLLMAAVTNACINLATRRKPFLRLVHEEHGEVIAEDPRDAAALPADAYAEGAELETAIAAGLQQLPPQQRAAVELKALGHSQQEIAEILRVSASNAGVLIHRARQLLAKHLQPFLGGEAVR